MADGKRLRDWKVSRLGEDLAVEASVEGGFDALELARELLAAAGTPDGREGGN